MQGDAFPASDFDRWAEVYDQDVLNTEAFPFAGYGQVLDAAVEHSAAKPGMSVLDLGIGTGNLAGRFVELGCHVWGSDFSEEMLAKARQKLREARLVLHDLREAWPSELERRFDRIVSGYTFHHFELERKVSMLAEISRDRLVAGGRIVIADISFRSLPDIQTFAAANGDVWEEEPYWVADQAQSALRDAGLSSHYEQVSPCGGVYRIEPA